MRDSVVSQRAIVEDYVTPIFSPSVNRKTMMKQMKTANMVSSNSKVFLLQAHSLCALSKGLWVALPQTKSSLSLFIEKEVAEEVLNW